MAGCIDLVVSEFNCSLPGIEPVCEKRSIPCFVWMMWQRKKAPGTCHIARRSGRDVSINVIAAAIASLRGV